MRKAVGGPPAAGWPQRQLRQSRHRRDRRRGRRRRRHGRPRRERLSFPKLDVPAGDFRELAEARISRRRFGRAFGSSDRTAEAKFWLRRAAFRPRGLEFELPKAFRKRRRIFGAFARSRRSPAVSPSSPEVPKAAAGARRASQSSPTSTALSRASQSSRPSGLAVLSKARRGLRAPLSLSAS
jgi:hypothetical protein